MFLKAYRGPALVFSTGMLDNVFLVFASTMITLENLSLDNRFFTLGTYTS